MREASTIFTSAFRPTPSFRYLNRQKLGQKVARYLRKVPVLCKSRPLKNYFSTELDWWWKIQLVNLMAFSGAINTAWMWEVSWNCRPHSQDFNGKGTCENACTCRWHTHAHAYMRKRTRTSTHARTGKRARTCTRASAHIHAYLWMIFAWYSFERCCKSKRKARSHCSGCNP